MKERFAVLSVDDISEGINYPIIKNYIVSDMGKEYPEISLEHPTAIDGMAFILCMSGNARVRINTRTFDVRENMLLSLLPGSIYEALQYSEDILFEYLFFSVDFTYELNIPDSLDIIQTIEYAPALQLTKEQFDSLLEFHAFMVKHYKREKHIYRELLAKNLLSAFLTELCGLYNENEREESQITSRYDEISRRFGKLLLENIKTERTVKFYADKMCLSPKYLSHLVKTISGKSVMEWIHDYTIVYIKAMLKTSNLSVLQISEELNFPDASCFGSYFKKHTGMTPVQYRES